MRHPFSMDRVCTKTEIDLFNRKVLCVKNSILMLLSLTVVFFFIATLYISFFCVLFVGTLIGMVAVHIHYMNNTAYELDNNYYMDMYTLCSSNVDAIRYAQQIKQQGRYFTNYEYHMIRRHVDPEYQFDKKLLIGESSS